MHIKWWQHTHWCYIEYCRIFLPAKLAAPSCTSVVAVLATRMPLPGSPCFRSRRSPAHSRPLAPPCTRRSVSQSVLVSPNRAHLVHVQTSCVTRRRPPRLYLPSPKRIHRTHPPSPSITHRAQSRCIRHLPSPCPVPLQTCILLYTVLPPPLDRFLRTNTSVIVHALVASYCGVPSLLQFPAAHILSSVAGEQRCGHNAPT